MTTQTASLESHVPPMPQDATVFTAPVHTVTLLEDRAQVSRRGTITLRAGQNRLVIRDVAPVLQDVSLRGEAIRGGATVADARVRRSMRVRLADMPEVARALEEQIRALTQAREAVLEDQQVAQQRLTRAQEMLQRGVDEIPQDAGWGMANHAQWKEHFEALFRDARRHKDNLLQGQFKAAEIADDVNTLTRRRQALDRVDHHMVAWVELDVVAPTAGEVELQVDYVVPNALWRPLHNARLLDGNKVAFQCSAAVWQDTGEDWVDAQLVFSTARSSLGHEPPLLRDDLLSVQKKNETVVVQARQVAVQKAGMGSGPRAGGGEPQGPRNVDLPGVDDGGETRNLRAPGKVSVASDGRPNVVPLFTFEDQAQAALVAVPELENKAFTRAALRNTGTSPVLAGPVELLQANGFVGWTQTLFVAPREKFELSFGPDDAVRITRKEQRAQELHSVTKWNITTHAVTVYLSNLSGETRTVEVTERIPVSEIEHVKVELNTKDTTAPVTTDENGFCRWKMDLPANGHVRINLRFSVSTAPGVQTA